VDRERLCPKRAYRSEAVTPNDTPPLPGFKSVVGLGGSEYLLKDGRLMPDGDRTQREMAPLISGEFSRRGMASVCFGLLGSLTLTAFGPHLTSLIRFSFQHEHYSHIILIPLVSASLFLLERRRIFAHVEPARRVGLSVLFAGGVLYWLGQGHSASASQNDQLSTAIFSMVVIWTGGFVLCYGLYAFRAGLFPVLFLFLMVPIPDFLLDRAIFWLQTGSAEVSDVLFQLAGVPILRTEFIFSLPGVTIEVAKECSGIRSSLVLVIMSLMVGHIFLRSAWTRVALVLAALPLLVVKNGIRIVTLTLLSMYVDPGFLTGSLHHQGGILFFLLAVALLAPILWLLRRSETPRKAAWPAAPTGMNRRFPPRAARGRRSGERMRPEAHR